MGAQILEAARQQAEICKIFGNVNRILIVWALGNQEMSVGSIAEAIDSSLQNTSQHLRLMKDKGILASRREGQAIYYRIESCKFVEACRIFQHTLPKAISENSNIYTESSQRAQQSGGFTDD